MMFLLYTLLDLFLTLLPGFVDEDGRFALKRRHETLHISPFAAQPVGSASGWVKGKDATSEDAR